MMRTWDSLRNHWRPIEQNFSAQAAEAKVLKENIEHIHTQGALLSLIGNYNIKY